jgi:phosphoglycolate phosphatase-like HAD superfamily hydrolase
MLLRHMTTALVDIDGTLLDSNEAHAQAWRRALSEHGVAVDVQMIRPLIGMGGDKLLPAIAGIAEDSARGQAIATRKATLFARVLPGLQPIPGAREMLEFFRDRDIEVIVATSAGDDEAAALLEQAGVADLVPERTSRDDAGGSKPEPGIVQAALARASRPSAALMIGDTPYDVEAATRAGIASVALRTGRYWSDADLAAADLIVDDPTALVERWRET